MTRLSTIVILLGLGGVLLAEPLPQDANTWVKRSPLPGGPVSPSLGYEGSLGWDPLHQVVIHWGGHNQGGGGEQNAETWTFDPVTARWTLKEPNTSPPGVCCAPQNVFDPVGNRFIRFRAFSGSHGWHWFRENYLSNSEVWSYDLATNTWRDMRPAPAPRTSPLRCAAWDSEHQVIVIFGGEGNQEGTVVYDPFTNAWTRMNPERQPAFRSAGNMAYDAARRKHILFGAQFTDDPHTWAYDLKKNEWTDLKPATMPPTDRNAAVLAYDPNSQKVIAVIQVVDRPDGEEGQRGHHVTWAYDAGTNTWTRMNPPREPDGWGNRRRIMVGIPEQNLILMEMYINPTLKVPGVDREQQIWTYRYGPARPAARVEPPRNLTATTTKETVQLTWQASPGAEEYVIYRCLVPRKQVEFLIPQAPPGTNAQPIPTYPVARPWQAEYKEIGRVGKDQLRFEDREPRRLDANFYFVRAVAGGQSADSVKVRSQPRLVEDVTVSVISTDQVDLSWPAPPEKDIARYVVERADVEVFSEDEVQRLKKDTQPLEQPSVGAVKAIGPFQTIGFTPETRFTDSNPGLATVREVKDDFVFKHGFSKQNLDAGGKPYRYGVRAYRVRAVNHLGTIGGPSPYFLTIPSSPKWVFAKEAGDDCQLKWQANPEKGLKGYRVYRMESPRINGPGQKVTRLTAEPIQETTYTDAKIGQDTRRYWIVAVDALGQEGTPSAPVWHYRQYRSYYKPFVGEWHQ